MQTIDQFNDNLGTAILLVGPAGGGKTSLGLSLFEKTYAFIADLNFKSGLAHLRRNGTIGNVIGFDTASPDENGKPVPANMRYSRMFQCVGNAMKDPAVDAIFLDSTSFIEDIIKAKICNAQTDEAVKLSGFDQWGNLFLAWKSFILQIRQSGKKLVMAAHEEKEKDESDGIFKYKIAVDGKIQPRLPALFSDVWRCEIVEAGAPPKPVWQLRTISNVRQEHLKNTLNLPMVCSHADAIKAARS